jgi:2-polyprenyl-3-methyl-5-hydroxy-6-metoxy-1,4-benzoquinol methylase
MKSKIFNILHSKESLRRHDLHHKETLNKIKKSSNYHDHDLQIIHNEIYRLERLESMLPNYHQYFSRFNPNTEIALEIGSGVGWLSHSMSAYFKKIIGIEPSRNANILANKYFHKDNINFICSDLIHAVAKNNFTVDFFTSCFVLSHLSNKQVSKINRAIEAIHKGAHGLLLERWSEKNTTEEKMWFVRNKKQWSSLFPKYNLEFLDNSPSNETFVGIKLTKKD